MVCLIIPSVVMLSNKSSEILCVKKIYILLYAGFSKSMKSSMSKSHDKFVGEMKYIAA